MTAFSACLQNCHCSLSNAMYDGHRFKLLKVINESIAERGGGRSPLISHLLLYRSFWLAISPWTKCPFYQIFLLCRHNIFTSKVHYIVSTCTWHQFVDQYIWIHNIYPNTATVAKIRHSWRPFDVRCSPFEVACMKCAVVKQRFVLKYSQEKNIATR